MTDNTPMKSPAQRIIAQRRLALVTERTKLHSGNVAPSDDGFAAQVRMRREYMEYAAHLLRTRGGWFEQALEITPQQWQNLARHIPPHMLNRGRAIKLPAGLGSLSMHGAVAFGATWASKV